MNKFLGLLAAHVGVKSMAVFGLIVLCITISIFSAIKLGPDNPIEKEADMLINRELGTDIDIDELVDDFVRLEKQAPPPTAVIQAR